MDRPNILLIMTDQQRFDSLGCTGLAAAHTPNLDRLAARGALFERCYTNNPICGPARASLMTGKSVPEHGVYRLYDVLGDDEILFTEHLQRLGYRTALFGKLHVSSIHDEAVRRHPHDGFDVYEWCVEGCVRMDSPFQAYRAWLDRVNPALCERLARQGRGVKDIPREFHLTHWAAERACEFIRDWDGEQPFFCKMSLFDPHNPYDDCPPDGMNRIDASSIPDPLIVDGEFDGKPADLLREHHESYLGDFDDVTLDDLRAMRRGYHGSIALADMEIGRVLDALDARGIADETLVIFTSDHGDMLGDHQLLVKGAFFYDPCVRVPLLMRWPGRFGSPRRVQALVQLHDLAATVLDAAGFPPDRLGEVMPESESLLGLAAGEAGLVRDFAVCCYRNSGITQGSRYWAPPIRATMFRDDTHKVNVYHDVGGGGETEGELYDMDSDPQELRNLWNDPAAADVRAALTQRLAGWLAEHERRPGSWGGEVRPTPDQQLPNTLKP